jgi:hypothetical protein
MSGRQVQPHADEDLIHAEWLAERAREAVVTLRECVEVNPGKCRGVPVLRGTRLPVAQGDRQLQLYLKSLPCRSRQRHNAS